ncbi:MAG: oxidase [Rhodomicrobium sp.]
MNGQSSQIRNLWVQSGVAWFALIALLALNVALAFVPLNGLNVTANLFVAFVMAAISGLFLMGLRGDSALVRLVAIASLFWLAIMFALTFTDYFTRLV